MAAGHAVRLLVRDSKKAEAYYRQLGERIPELVVGDVTDIASVKMAPGGVSCGRACGGGYTDADRFDRAIVSS